MKTIRIACDVKDSLPLDEIEPFQGNLKSLSSVEYAKLKRAIIETGFAFPVYIWKSPEDVNFIIGGHQRCRVLKELRDVEGFIVPPIPVVFVEAESATQAKRRILQDVAQYGQIDRQGLYEFMYDASLSIVELDDLYKLPDLNVTDFGVEFFKEDLSTLGVVTEPLKEWVEMPEFNQDDKTSFRHIVVHFNSEEDAEKFFQIIGQNDTGETRSIWFPPQENLTTESKRYSDNEEPTVPTIYSK